MPRYQTDTRFGEKLMEEPGTVTLISGSMAIRDSKGKEKILILGVPQTTTVGDRLYWTNPATYDLD
jgi:hypothetical protein